MRPSGMPTGLCVWERAADGVCWLPDGFTQATKRQAAMMEGPRCGKSVALKLQQASLNASFDPPANCTSPRAW